MTIEGKVAVVSGGASGIGRATVIALAERGAKVLIAVLGEEVLADARQKGGVLRPDQIAAGVLELIEDESRFGAVMSITVGGGQEYTTSTWA